MDLYLDALYDLSTTQKATQKANAITPSYAKSPKHHEKTTLQRAINLSIERCPNPQHCP